MSAPRCDVPNCILAQGHGGTQHLYKNAVGIEASLARILEKARKIPDRDTLCRCGDSWRNGVRVPTGWIEVSDKGRGMWRRCELCNQRGTVPAPPGARKILE